MQQPELGLRLTTLRKQQQLTQEELAEKSHVSVRTIQRIESGEVLPRISTIKILLQALGETPESFMQQKNETMETRSLMQVPGRNTLLMAAIAGAIYLIMEIILGTLDVAWFVNKGEEWNPLTNYAYCALTVVMVAAFILFARGFITLGSLFENKLLQIGSWLNIGIVMLVAILDITSLYVGDRERLLFFYAPASVLSGAVTIIFGVSLLRLQDSMGELSRVAGVLEIIIGCMLITVIFFFIGHIVMIPAVVVEIILLYRGYEYLTRTSNPVVA